MCDDILEVLSGALQLPSVDGLGGFTGVLERDTQVRAPRTGALCGRNLLCSVTDLDEARRRISYGSFISFSCNALRWCMCMVGR